MVNLILTNSYFNLFPILTDCIKDSKEIDRKKLVFCESKVSLMVERFICQEMGGSFNTDVYSFGKFLCTHKKFEKVLSKEGSAMAIKRILNKANLTCFKASKENLAPTLYDLFIQLKSASVSPQDILNATYSSKGILKNKLTDIYEVYSAYENYIKENGFDDQSSILAYLPEIIQSDETLAKTDVYIVGFSSFTKQIRLAISSLFKSANSVTAILVEGDNQFVYVNETSSFIKGLAKEQGENLLIKRVDGDFSRQGKILAENLFSPVIASTKLSDKTCDDGIYFSAHKNPFEEILAVGETIKKCVMEEGLRYKDVAIATSSIDTYIDDIKSVFGLLDIPYFIDQPLIPFNHPLITLIFSYIDAIKSGFERENVISFFKNPLYESDKDLTDKFENYIKKYNVNYKGIFIPFKYEMENENLINLEAFRAKLCADLSSFNVRKMLNSLDVDSKLKQYAKTLKNLGEDVESAISEQIYEKVKNLLDEMDEILSGEKLSFYELKNLLTSGLSAMQMSIIPQYNDAVFIGGFKEIALAKTKRLFVIGLTSEVPSVQADVSLLSDDDISSLEKIEVLVEPKIRVVNKRTRENVALALASFSERLYLSYPISSVDGKQNIKSEIFEDIRKLFNLLPYPQTDGYLTKKQGKITFAKKSGEFARGKHQDDMLPDFTIPSSYFSAVDDKDELNDILQKAKMQVKERLSGNNVRLIKDIISPTTIEEYHTCPYKAFVSKTLKIKERDEGNVNVLSVGNVMHEMLNEYVKNLHRIKDKSTSNELFDEISSKILEKEEYNKFLSDATTKFNIDGVLKECREYCYKTYMSIYKSKFTSSRGEVGFGDGKEGSYPPISLVDGKVKLKGKIDRVDQNDKYFRVLDYKTGKVDAMDKALFAGVKLQLYLYANAVKNDKDNEKKIPAGLYYLPIADKYQKEEDKVATLTVGKTLSEEEALNVQDQAIIKDRKPEFIDVKFHKTSGAMLNVLDREGIEKRMDYAIKICETAARRMLEGVIVPSPYDKACEYCEYSALCGQVNPKARTLARVDYVFKESPKNDKKGGAENE